MITNFQSPNLQREIIRKKNQITFFKFAIGNLFVILYQLTNKNIIMSSFKSSGDIQRKRMGQTAVSDNQSSSVTLNELAKKARKNIL